MKNGRVKKVERKYEFTGETKEFAGRTLHRIVAVRDFGSVKKGTLGGWIEKEENLCHEADCWVADEACAFSDAYIRDQACIDGKACIDGEACIGGKAYIGGEACVGGEAYVGEYAYITGGVHIAGNVYIEGRAVVESPNDYLYVSPIDAHDSVFTAYKSELGIEWNIGCFRGTLEELEKAVEGNEGNHGFGKEYRILIELIKEKFKKN
ncbi:hypothetical protein ACOJUR_12355 [Alicyclobacillus tolerans]|uniref:hypothetical protein n=1 Tax=Alicyclobacillus tolerans TaxID=90970 RepID=UPI003B795BBB